MLVDTHCHLDEYDNLDEVIKNMDNNIMIVSGVSDKSNKEAIRLCNKYSNIYATLGFEADKWNEFTDDSYNLIKSNLDNPKVVGVGEIGLDYHWDKNCDEQKKLFIKLINLARVYNKTIVIHSRDAISDTYDILEKHAKGLKIVLHCYNSSLEMANKFIKLGCMFGIGGVVTFKNARKLVSVVSSIDLKHLVLETDSPYLTPEPYRGKKNEPCNVRLVALKIAEIKGISLEKVINETTLNACRQFDLKLNL